MSFLEKTKQIAKKAINTTVDKTVTIFNTAKNAVKNEIDEYKAEQERKREESIALYSKHRDSVLNSMDNLPAKEFVGMLEKSPTDLTYKIVKKIKETFPIPVEQEVLWAEYIVKTTRSGGIIATDKGIFLKTVVSVFDEKNINKNERKVSQLFYYPWEMFLDASFVNTTSISNIENLDVPMESLFYQSVKAFENKNAEILTKSANYYSNDRIFEGTESAIAGSLLKDDVLFTRNNSANHSPTGHGFFAEKANTIADRLEFKNAKVIGGDNAKDGADRLVDGVNYQTKYYKTAARSVGATFDNNGSGNYRYYNKNDTPMKLEVPSDQYDAAVEVFKKKIINGKVRGVSDPNEAEKIVVKGHYTYEQTKNMAKAGTIDSLKFDIETGAVVATCAFGISYLINSFLIYRETKDVKEATIGGLLAGGKAGALTLTAHVLVSQLSRTKVIGSFMSKSVINNGIASGIIGFVVFSIPDTFKVATRKISGAQYAANLAVLSASIIGGTVGTVAGAAIGTSAGTAAGMGVGSAPLAVAGGVGGATGGLALGTVAGIGTSKLIDFVFEGDDKRISRLFNAISMVMFAENLLSEDEINSFIAGMNKVSTKKFKSLFEKIHASKEQERTIRDFISPYIDEIIAKREKFDPNMELLLA